MSQPRIKTLEEILRESPEARRIAQEMRTGISKRWEVQDSGKPDCPTCGGMGFVRGENIPLDHPKYGQPIPCPDPNCPVVGAQKSERYTKLCTTAQIPAEYLAVEGEPLTFALWWELFKEFPKFRAEKQEALGAALAFVAAKEAGFMFTLDDAAVQVGLAQPEYASPRRCSIVYSGLNGVGKTSLAVCIARELLERGIQVMYLRMDEFFAALQERFKPKDEYEFGGDVDDEMTLLRMYQQVPVLILDELPMRPGRSDWWKERAEQLINYRYTHQLPTIITTNLNAETVIQQWGMTTGHRIQAMAHWLEIGGLELRTRAAMVKSR